MNSGYHCLHECILIRFGSIVKKTFRLFNHARIRSWNKQTLSNEGKVLAEGQQHEPFIWFELGDYESDALIFSPSCSALNNDFK